MNKTIAMFPGQGSQFVGMGRVLLSEFPYLKETFEEAEDAISLGIKKLCFDGPEDELRLTANLQPSILTISVATWRVLEKEAGFKPEFFAGHSLGEYSALVAAGKLDFPEAVSLVRKRGAAMQKAVPAGKGAMAAVLNYNAADLVPMCEKISKSMEGSVEVVNFNSPQQLIISGSKAPVEKVVENLADVEKVRCTMLPVSAPFHSKLMSPAREEMAPLLNAAKFHENETKVIANITGELAEPYKVDMLIQQIDSPVLWTQTLESALKLGVTRYVEVGPGRVLFGLARRTLSRDMTLAHTGDIAKSIEGLKS